MKHDILIVGGLMAGLGLGTYAMAVTAEDVPTENVIAEDTANEGEGSADTVENRKDRQGDRIEEHFDTDGDGSLSDAERRAVRDTRRDHRRFIDRREDGRDYREDRFDRREDIRDRREDIADLRRDRGIADRREDVRDREEDRWDRREDARDHREDWWDRAGGYGQPHIIRGGQGR
ncbi:MAG: hypothetical protein HY356_05535 [Gammaproteobacteria bacterium]|nr:hypothetical protein [Gammaproteobacteria bacterium]